MTRAGVCSLVVARSRSVSGAPRSPVGNSAISGVTPSSSRQA
jgi:hypothetical protein